MTAGVAAAEVSFSGTAQVALTDDNGKKTTAGTTNIGTGHANGADAGVETSYVLTTGYDFNVALSAATDNGITMSTGFDMGAGMMVDYDDDDRVEAQGTTIGGAELTIGWNGYTISAEQNGVDNLYDDDFAGDDLGISGAIGGVTFAATTDFETDASSVKLGYTMGDLTATFTQTNKNGNTATNADDDASKLAISYVMGDLTLTASTDDKGISTTNDSENKVGFSYKMDAITLSYTSIDPEETGKGMGDEWDAKIAYSAGGLSASYAVDEADATTMIATYDLGGGATVFVASHDKANTVDDMNTVGINFKF
jgi:hypothetical protein